MRYEEFRNKLVEAVLTTAGDTTGELCRNALERGTVSGPLAPYVSKVAHHAYRVTDADVEALRQAGLSDDSLFEITGATAVGAAVYRLTAVADDFWVAEK